MEFILKEDVYLQYLVQIAAGVEAANVPNPGLNAFTPEEVAERAEAILKKVIKRSKAMRDH